MPITPTRLVAVTWWVSSGLKTVMPPHSIGPADARSMLSGRGITHCQSARSLLAKPPRLRMVGTEPSRQLIWLPLMQASQWPQLRAVQPMPTFWPIFSPLSCAALPSAATRPITS
ncbi:Uncharacterised protein [Klebsiella pneumoniae subsp. ozaenae]|uniref:Uncharacterized protein n=1 Tax=Klebsiella pneumoniae subsp. ozaenae TaxID=574 RepID=A0A378B378_KLEPO|nr:Uncharacterised protein [Klebsiella pneumoniae subsp. ozaenae]